VPIRLPIDFGLGELVGVGLAGGGMLGVGGLEEGGVLLDIVYRIRVSEDEYWLVCRRDCSY
jgi:hypothetical protein